MGCVSEMCRLNRPAARGLSRGWFGNRPDVGRDEGDGRFAAVVNVVSESYEVRVVTELRIVRDVAAGRACVPAPAACEIAWIRGLRPTKEEVGIREIRVEGDRTIEPAVALRVPLDLGITGRQGGGRAGKGPEVGRAQQGEIAAVVHPDQLIDKFDVS